MRYRAPIFGVLVAVLLAAGFYFFAYQPKAEEQAALEAETATLQSQAAQLRSEIAQLEEIKANELDIRAALSRLKEYIPEGDPAQPGSIRQFQLVADAAGVEIDSLTYGDPQILEDAPATGEAGTTLTEIPVTMTVEGGYFQLVDLLRRLEVEEHRALLIDSINVAEHEAKFPVLATTWTGKLFAVMPLAEAAEAGSADAPAPGTTPPPAGDGSTTTPSAGETPTPPPGDGATPPPADGSTPPPAEAGTASANPPQPATETS